MSGTACEHGLQAIGCRNWFLFTIPAVRTISYSLGAWLCWRFIAYGTSPIEGALLVRFPPLPEIGKTKQND
jgi:hypothetical protein